MEAREYPAKCAKIYEQDVAKEYIKELCRFKKDYIVDDAQRKGLISNIKDGIGNHKVWALLGKLDSKDHFICLQVASSENIYKEISSAIEAMPPVKEGSETTWRSYFHPEGVCQVTYGLDVRSQKYNKMYGYFDEFVFCLIDYEIYLKEEDTTGFNIVKYAECKYAYDTKAMYWNPFGKEYYILRHLEA